MRVVVKSYADEGVLLDECAIPLDRVNAVSVSEGGVITIDPQEQYEADVQKMRDLLGGSQWSDVDREKMAAQQAKEADKSWMGLSEVLAHNTECDRAEIKYYREALEEALNWHKAQAANALSKSYRRMHLERAKFFALVLEGGANG